MRQMGLGQSRLFTGILIAYTIAIMCFAVLFRETRAHGSIQRVFFWGYERSYIEVISRDNLINLIVFIPIGFFSALISSRFRVVKALLVGLLVSETIECAQLIWKRGVFDVDDMINNTVGAFFGGLLVELMSWTKQKRFIY